MTSEGKKLTLSYRDVLKNYDGPKHDIHFQWRKSLRNLKKKKNDLPKQN